MQFKSAQREREFKELYKAANPANSLKFSFIFAVADNMESAEEKTFDRFAEVFFECLDSQKSVTLSDIPHILNLFRMYWKYAYIIPAAAIPNFRPIGPQHIEVAAV